MKEIDNTDFEVLNMEVEELRAERKREEGENWLNDPGFAAAIDKELRDLEGEDYVEQVIEGNMTRAEWNKRWGIKDGEGV